MDEAAKGFSSAALALPLPRRLGRRVLLKLAARGGMGEIYLAATTGIEGAERPCIVKTVRRDHIHDGSFRARFLDEARVQAQLQHPGVVQVLEATTDDNGEPYTVVEYVEGRSLCDVRQRGIQRGVKIAWADAVSIAVEVAQALAHVHERPGPDGSPLGIVHRDLSPQNVMVSYAGEVKLIDFGTARGHNRRCHTVAGVVFAKPGYVAPEVARQQVGDGRIDLYALGVVLWELCSGRRFLTMDPQHHLDHVAAGKLPIPPVAQSCGAPRELDEIIGKLTKNDPDERYSRASLAVPDLARLLTSAPAAEAGERGVRARISALMRKLWPHEPSRARSDFMRLLIDARELLHDRRPSCAAPSRGQASGAIAPQMMPEDPSLLAGTPYRLVHMIGEGSGGAVWEAEHVELGRRVALKVLAPEHASSHTGLERFRREARAMATLSHPNFVQILDFGKSLDGRVFLAMELLVGETLDARLRRSPIDPDEATRIAIATCNGLAAAHAAGLVHRDIKPQNLMLTKDGVVKLLDFGIAWAIADGSGAVLAGAKERAMRGFAILGTPEYMAPEQVAGDTIDQRTDVYALGCVLYQMLTGTPPFEGSPVVVMGKQLRDTPKPPRACSRGRSQRVSRQLNAVLMRAMAKAPRGRFPTAAAMAASLQDALGAANRRRAQARSLANYLVIAIGMVAAAGAAARWTRTHGSAREIAAIPSVPTPIAFATSPSTPIPIPNQAPTPSLSPIVTLAPAPIATIVPTPLVDLATLRPAAPRTGRPRLRLPASAILAAEKGSREGSRRSNNIER